jgi:hypothetical protein
MTKIKKGAKLFRLGLIKVVEEDARGSLHRVLATLHSVSCKALIAALVFFLPRRCPYKLAAKQSGGFTYFIA